MNNRSLLLTKLIALLILAVMTLSMMGCDALPFLNQSNSENSNDNADDNNAPDSSVHTHDYVDGFCDCGAIDPDYVPEHIHKFQAGKCACGAIDPDYKPAHKHNFVDGKCECGESDPNLVPDHEHNFVDGKCECGESDPDYNGSTTEYKTVTIAEALEIAAANPNGTTELYYINATVKTMKNASYGEMYIEDETGEIYVYGTRGEDGETYFDQLTEKPVKGDKVVLLCQLSQYNGQNQVKQARLISFEHIEVDPGDLTDYTEMTVADAREADEGAKVIVSGVVAQITYSNGKVPSGVILVDGTSSIYVYSSDLAGQVAIGNTVKIAAEKAYYVLSSEQSNAEKFGYKGSNQLDNVIVISSDKETTAFHKSWITESTIKEIMDTPVTEDITTKIFKVNALVKKAPGNGFTNYYFNDIDGYTGSYTYSQCNGSDFSWIDAFDGKICTVYIVALNAKSSTTGCTWRFLPVEIIDEGYTFNLNDAPKYAVTYHGLGQFLPEYTGDPAAELITSISSELLGFEGVSLSYASSDESVIYFTTDDGKVIFHCGNGGKATVTITATYGEATYSESVEISVVANESVDYITVADAILAADDSTVTVKGIVGPSVVNRDAFYLFGEDGSVITVLVNDTAIFSEIEIGHEIIVTGKREHFVNADKYNGNYTGQATIVQAEIVANYYGNHEYPTTKFVTGKTVEDLRALDIMTDYSNTVFVTKAIVQVQETAYYTNIKLTSLDGSTTITLYCSSANQYSWLKAFAGQEVTLELAACNWNDKSFWAFCALAVYNEDGTKTLNTFNWN